MAPTNEGVEPTLAEIERRLAEVEELVAWLERWRDFLGSGVDPFLDDDHPLKRPFPPRD